MSAEFLGYDLQGRPQFHTVRTEIGELLYQLKYRGSRAAAAELARVAAEFVQDRGWKVDLIVPVPPSRVRPFQPLLAIARQLSGALGAAYDFRALLKVRDTPELKGIEELAEREAALAGAFDAVPDRVAGRRVLLLDDLYRSGASMREAARTLQTHGTMTALMVLALTRTRSRT